MLQQYLLDYCQRQHEVSLITKQNKNKSATRGAELVTIGIPPICLYNFKANRINILSKYNGERHKLSDMTLI